MAKEVSYGIGEARHRQINKQPAAAALAEFKQVVANGPEQKNFAGIVQAIGPSSRHER